LFKQALRLQPDNPDLLHNLGVAWAKQGVLPVAQVYFTEAIRAKPDAAETHNNLGLSYLQQNRLAEAEGCFRAALRTAPDHVDALNHLGVVFANQERWAEAAEWYRAAVLARPDFPEAHKNLGLVRLIRGDLRGGWREYEWRWRCKGNSPRSLPAPAWDGGEVRGGPLLLYAEQGLGDTIQFARLAAAAA